MSTVQHEARLCPIRELHPYPGNPRRGDVELIRESLRQNGQYRPLVVRLGTSEVLAGNHTLQAAIAEGWRDIWVTYVDVDDDHARRIVLVDNRANDAADYDLAALTELLGDLPDLTGTGYDQPSVEELLAELADQQSPVEGLTDPDEIPELPQKARNKTGDLWALGEHRLICGDATDNHVVQRVAHEGADCIWADPPYNVDYRGVDGQRIAIANDHLPAGEFQEFLTAALTAAAGVARPGSAIYLAHSDAQRHAFDSALDAAGFTHRQTLIWVKTSFVLGRQDYQWQHEPILYGWRTGAGHRWFGGFDKRTVIDDEIDPRTLSKRELVDLVQQLRNEHLTDVIRAQKPAASEQHPTMKPVALIEPMLRNSSRAGELVLDPFAGSGSTLIACERLRRRARAVELDPGYCDVIIDRWQQFTGGKARRVRS